MSNGDDADGEDAGDEEADTTAPEAQIGDFEQRLEDAASALEAAETEDDLDEVEATLDNVAEDIESTALPEPDEEDEDDPAETLEDRLSDLRDDVDDQRGPYLEDVTSAIEDAESTLAETRWTKSGQPDAVAAAAEFADTASEILDEDLSIDSENAEGATEEIIALHESVSETDLDADEDAETIAALLDAVDDFEDGLGAAEEWSDLTVHEQLDVEGFYDVLEPENRRDFPSEWNAIRLYEKAGEVEPILMALEKFESDFMEENALDALEHIAPEEAFEQIHSMTNRRNKQPIRVLGRIGDERACETLHDFLDAGDQKLETETLRALGSIGSEESTQPVANRLAAENQKIRTVAARALGMIGDTRAIEPLADVLESDEADEVRASAAWALNQIGTERALDIAAEYADDHSYIVQHEAQNAADA